MLGKQEHTKTSIPIQKLAVSKPCFLCTGLVIGLSSCRPQLSSSQAPPSCWWARATSGARCFEASSVALFADGLQCHRQPRQRPPLQWTLTWHTRDQQRLVRVRGGTKTHICLVVMLWRSGGILNLDESSSLCLPFSREYELCSKHSLLLVITSGISALVCKR